MGYRKNREKCKEAGAPEEKMGTQSTGTAGGGSPSRSPVSPNLS